MFSDNWKLVLSCALFLSAPHLAAGQTDQQAYCSYVMEQAQAQRDLLRTPSGTAGFTQPETGLPMQVVAGATLGLSGLTRISRSTLLRWVHSRMAQSPSPTILQATPLIGISIMPRRPMTNGKKCRRAMSCAAWRSCDSNWSKAFRCKKPSSNP